MGIHGRPPAHLCGLDQWCCRSCEHRTGLTFHHGVRPRLGNCPDLRAVLAVLAVLAEIAAMDARSAGFASAGRDCFRSAKLERDHERLAFVPGAEDRPNTRPNPDYGRPWIPMNARPPAMISHAEHADAVGGAQMAAAGCDGIMA